MRNLVVVLTYTHKNRTMLKKKKFEQVFPLGEFSFVLSSFLKPSFKKPILGDIFKVVSVAVGVMEGLQNSSKTKET